jgi:urease accessory protein
MIEAHTIISNPTDSIDTITLDAQGRHRRRIKLVSDGGITFLLNLERTQFLHAGQGLKLTDGRVIYVKAKEETLYEITGHDTTHLLNLAWHIGNRHLKADIQPTRILIQVDRVIGEMLEGLGGTVKEVTEAFNPVQGAYDHHHSHDHKSNHGDAG